MITLINLLSAINPPIGKYYRFREGFHLEILPGAHLPFLRFRDFSLLPKLMLQGVKSNEFIN